MTVRRAVPGDAEAVRRVRLRALADAPKAFDATLEEETALSLEDWERRFSSGATFVLEREGDLVGIVAGVPHVAHPDAVLLVGMWVAPEARGTGGGDALVQAVVSWADAEGASEVRLDVGRYNEQARRLYERNGFRLTGKEVVRERDGLVEVEMACPLPRRRGA